MRPILMAAARIKPPLTFSQSGNSADYSYAFWTITASEPVVWNWSTTGSVPSSSVPNGGTAQSITFSLSNTGKADLSSNIHVVAGAQTFDFTLSAWGSLHP